MTTLTHVDQSGAANMVDVTDKAVTIRTAIAEGYISMSPATIEEVINHKNKKGDVITTAKIAGIQAAKKCADLIPLCHPLALSKVDVDFDVQPNAQQIRVQALCKLAGKTGVEMEALTAVSVALLTLFDMCKASDPEMCIHGIRVIEKTGGKTGHWRHSV
ncbi:cyclic pyranopterin monophosphate synthase MoaC [Flocculibacter collagenilyticus]|uniref:cyclic pyranopterin monophosphate synthase MoaC n=1 Tax=Flocculibacter collagenilyticus TaxID=2744479 RepID=UPI0018F41802|nr:cyclic pyranopterin monophosphate synthase MoaC [Flocculibacter collagenilyticus]